MFVAIAPTSWSEKLGVLAYYRNSAPAGLWLWHAADGEQEQFLDTGYEERVPTGEATRLRIEVRGLLEYPAYQAMRELLTGPGKATSAIPVRFARGVAVLDLELPGRSAGAWIRDRKDAEQLVERLVSAGPPTLLIRPIQVEPEEIVLAVTWTPPTPVDSDGY